MYLYTGHIKFAPYGSKENRRSDSRSAKIVSSSEDSLPLFFFFFLNSSSIPVGIRMDRPAGYLLHRYLRDPYYLNPVKARRRNRESPL